MEEKILEEYVIKMLEVQKERHEKPLSLKELKEIALSVGMSEADWNHSQEVMQQHLQKGQGHLRNKNWLDAAKELEQAVAINPYLEQGLFGIAQAYYELYKAEGRASDQEKAREYANRALRNEDTSLDNASIALLNDIRQAEVVHRDKSKNRMVMLTIAFTIVLLIVISYFGISIASLQSRATALDQKMVEVEKNWAQVDNVYKRRETLIPQIVKLTESASEYDKAKLDKLLELQKNLNSGNDRTAYIRQQEELSKMMADALGDAKVSATNFRDLQVAIEGSENRLRVEWKKYNDAVSEYNSGVVSFNSAINSFPGNLFGMRPKEKIVSEQVK